MAKRKQRKKPKRERGAPKPGGIMQVLETDPGPWAYWLLVLAAFGWAISANADLQDGHKTLKWRETNGTIVKTDVSKTTSGGVSGNSSRAGGGGTSSSSTWHVDVSYRYEVDSHAYSGDRIAWGTGWSYDTERAARAKIRELGARSTIPVFYDPARPSHAVLERGISSGKLVIGVGMIGAAFGLLIFRYLRQRPVQQHLPPKKRQGPLIRRALLGGFAAAAVFGGLQYLVYVQLFT